MKSTLVLVSTAALMLFVGTGSAAPINRTFEINFTRFNHPDGPPTFDLRFSGLGSSDSVVTPNGHTYTGSFFPFTPTPTNISEAQLYSELTGTWTLNAYTSFNQPAEVHQFNFLPFSADALFHVAPIILTPAANSTVPPNFTLSWGWPEGVTPPTTGRSAGASGGSSGAHFDFGQFSGNSIPISVTFDAGVTQSTYRLNGGSVQVFNNMTTAPTTVAANPFYNYSVREVYSNQAYVNGVTVVVPEPGSMILASLLAAIVIASAGRCRL